MHEQTRPSSRQALESTSRRAFALDSRAVWVEQSHESLGSVRRSPFRKCSNGDDFHNESVCIVPRDNYAIGPGDYSPERISRHISTPNLGGSQGVPKQLKLQFGLHTRTGSSKNDRFSYKVSDDLFLPGQANMRKENVTIFHENDRRQSLDPKLRFCSTPGPQLGHESLLESTQFDGKKKSRSVVLGPDNIPFGERNETKLALPSYDIMYESMQLRPKPKLGVMTKHDRVLALDEGRVPVYEEDKPKINYLPPQRPRSIPTKKPVLKSLNAEPLSFDTSAYKNLKRPELLEISPGTINNLLKHNIFGAMLRVPKQHKTQIIESRVATRVRSYADRSSGSSL